jgi:hypothetical protein
MFGMDARSKNENFIKYSKKITDVSEKYSSWYSIMNEKS